MNRTALRCRIIDYNSGTDADGTGTHQRCYHSTMSRRGKFITFEGLDGTGKSTQLRKLAAALREAGHKVVETREPGGTATGEKIRRVLLDSATEDLSPMAEMALMFASRAQHIAEVIQPALDHGQIVLCDRFTDSTEAYQGSGRKLGSEAVLRVAPRALWRLAARFDDPARFRPRILCEPSPAAQSDCSRDCETEWEAGLRQASCRRKPLRATEPRFFARVHQGYLAIAARETQRVVVVDARGTPTQTHQRIVEEVGRKLKLLPAARQTSSKPSG